MMTRLWIAAVLIVATALIMLGARNRDPGADDRGHQSSVSGGAASRAAKFDPHILVDQFGYRPADPKVAVIRDPAQGYDHADQITPGPQYEVRRAEDGTV